MSTDIASNDAALAGRWTTVSGADTEAPQVEAPSLRRRMRRWFYRRFVRGLTLSQNIVLSLAERAVRRRPRPANGQCDILLTGRFDSDNWVVSHVYPLAASKNCRRVRMVSTNPVPEIDKVKPIYPGRWLVRLAGATGARLLTFVCCAVRTRPDVVGGFHLLINGLVVSALARLIGARSMYFCVGGPTEVEDGGIWGEPGPFAKMETPDPVVERRLVRAAGACDMVITMGTRAATFLRGKGADTNFHVVSGGIDSRRFSPSDDSSINFDLILVGRLAEIKRIDTFLHAMKKVSQTLPASSAAIVGDGPMRPALERLAFDLGIDRNVTFLGHQKNVEQWLKQARIFCLTSRSEGLALSMMEAMMCGVPAVVSDVGDLGDLIDEGVNGYLVERSSPDAFAQRMIDLLTDQPKLAAFSRAARRAALRYRTEATISQWDGILADGAATDS